MNLISDRWIPVRRKDGSKETIAPCQMTDGIGGDNPILNIASLRPDFDGALTQFLIGLLQTACTPTEERWWDWREREAAPAPKVLKACLEMMIPAFELENYDGPLFMQERLGDKSETHPVAYLLIGAPTRSTCDQNIDHFQKRGRDRDCLCRACAAAALYTLQTFAPSGGGGGDGKFTGLRGGGPLTTLILGDTLWETVWLNVVHGETFARGLPDHKTFPWLKLDSFITEAKPIKTIHSADMNPAHVFWGMPRRIHLDFAPNESGSNAEYSRCVICGKEDDRICVEYRDLTGGLSYQEKYQGKDKKGKNVTSKRPSWLDPKHPLSPYAINSQGEPSAVHPQPGGIGYRHWLGLIVSNNDGKNERRPALVVDQYRNTGEDAKVWAFGFDMDNMKARCWYDATMPILAVPEALQILFNDLAVRLILTAGKVAEELLPKSLKMALFPEKSKVRSDDLGFVRTDFWEVTEPRFYVQLDKARITLLIDPLAHSILEEWYKILREAALTVFDRHSQTGNFDAVKPRRIAKARNELRKTLDGAPLKKILGLPKSAKPTSKKP